MDINESCNMIDYISATSFLGKDTIIFSHLQPVAQYSSGLEKYYIEGCERLEVWFNPNSGMMTIKGSVAYYWQGHNFVFTRKDFVKAIDYIRGLLKVDIWKSEINAFEFGLITSTELKPKEYIIHHSAKKESKLIQEQKAKDNGNFRWYHDSSVKLKMYDAGKNIKMKQNLTRKRILQDMGWDSDANYLKWEAHYLKPEYLNKGKALKLYNLVNPDWQDVFKEDLYLQYKKLIPMKNIILPKDKKDLSTTDIIALALSEESINQGNTIESVKKMLYAKINAIPDEILTKSDKDARKRKISQVLSKFRESPESKWDLSDKIQEALDADN